MRAAENGAPDSVNALVWLATPTIACALDAAAAREKSERASLWARAFAFRLQIQLPPGVGAAIFL
jgi:hypothetical protein